MDNSATVSGSAAGREPAAGRPPTAEQHLEILLAGLRETIDRARPRPSLRELSRVLGRNHRYVDTALRGETKLRVEEVLRLLALVGADSRELFYHLFPLGGELERRLVETLEAGEGRAEDAAGVVPALDLDLVRTYLRRGHPPPTPERAAERARSALRERVRRSKVSQKQLSARVFGSPHTLRSALRGLASLSFQQIFAVLEALEEEPGRFFLDVLGPEDGELAAGITWQSLLDRSVPMDQAGVWGFTDERREKGVKPFAEPEEEKEG